MHLKIVVLLIIMATSNIIAGNNVAETTSRSCSDDTFSYEQSTKGTGFFSTHQDIEKNNGFGVTVKGSSAAEDHDGYYDPYWFGGFCLILDFKPSVYFKSSMHGSGTIENEDILKYQDLSVLKEEKKHYGEVEVSSNNASTVVSGNGDNQMVHSSETIPLGNGYYSSNPIKYDSQLSKSSFLGNQNLISHEILYANSIDSEDQFVVNNTFIATDVGGTWGVSVFDVAFGLDRVANKKFATTMKFSDDVDGAIQIRAFNGDYPRVNIEEDYFGRYQLSRNISTNAIDNSTFNRPGFLTD